MSGERRFWVYKQKPARAENRDRLRQQGELVAIADAVHARRQLLHTVRSAQAIADLCVGDAVRFTNRIRPRYLEHELAEVTEVDDRTVTVWLWRPVGRFNEGELWCPAARATQTRPRNVDPAQLTVPLSGGRVARRQPTTPVDPLPVLRGIGHLDEGFVFLGQRIIRRAYGHKPPSTPS